jgi:hypothetical protein
MRTAYAWGSPLVLIAVVARILAVLRRCASPPAGSRDDLKLKEIAAVLGVTEPRACRLHSPSIARLQAKMRSH